MKSRIFILSICLFLLSYGCAGRRPYSAFKSGDYYEQKLFTDSENGAYVRLGTLEAEGKVDNPRVIEILTMALWEKDYWIRKNAVELLGESKSVKAVGPLIEVLKRDKNSSIQPPGAKIKIY